MNEIENKAKRLIADNLGAILKAAGWIAVGVAIGASVF